MYKMGFRAIGTGGMSHSSQRSVVYTTSLVAPECLCSVSPCSDLGRVLSLSVCFCWSYGLNVPKVCALGVWLPMSWCWEMGPLRDDWDTVTALLNGSAHRRRVGYLWSGCFHQSELCPAVRPPLPCVGTGPCQMPELCSSIPALRTGS